MFFVIGCVFFRLLVVIDDFSCVVFLVICWRLFMVLILWMVI